MLKAVFYARFHPERGPSVIHEYPQGSIINPSEEDALVSWSNISSYIIPPYELCDQPLSICLNGHRVLGFPISLEDSKYERNRFTFNTCFVLSETEDTRPWEQIVSKTAAFFASMEKEDGLLQTEEDLKGLKWAGEEEYPAAAVGLVYSLLESIFEDLNMHGETCSRVDDLHILNLRVTIPKTLPPKVRTWDVPLLIRPLPDPNQWTWDLTLQRIYPHIDGVKHVQKIAELADVELKLAKHAVGELVYHDRVMILDIFHFQAIYGCTSDIAWFAKDQEMQEECLKYVVIDGRQETSLDTEPSSKKTNTNAPEREDVINLYTGLSPGITLVDFWQTHRPRFAVIDIRRFITFGIIKGFLRRIHKFAVALDRPQPSRISPDKTSSGSNSKPRSNDDAVRELDRAWKRAALWSGWATPPSVLPTASLGKSNKSAEEMRSAEDEKLRGFLDGKHCMDEICAVMHLSEKKIVERLRSGRFGDVVLFNK